MASMEELEIPSCPVCQEDYDERVNPMIMECGHTICNICFAQLKIPYQPSSNVKCPTCRAESNPTKVVKNFKLAEALGIIKKMRVDHKKPPVNPVECSNCGKVDEENDMFICRNCVNEAFDCDVSAMNLQVDLDVKTVALCGSCAIRFHVFLKHETVAYFPIWSGSQFESRLESVNVLKGDLQEQISNIDKRYSQFKLTVQKFQTEVDKMTEMMRKGKSSRDQEDISKQIQQEIAVMSSYVVKIFDAIVVGDTEYKGKLEDLMSRNNVTEKEKCKEVSENKTNEKCVECGEMNDEEKFFCCKTCSEIVTGLMEHTLEESRIEPADLTSFSICCYCILKNHKADNHEIVKYLDVQRVHHDTVRLINIDQKVKSLNGKLSETSETFSHHIILVKEYENKISKLSEIATGSQGLPEHAELVVALEKILEEAEAAVVSLKAISVDDKNGSLTVV